MKTNVFVYGTLRKGQRANWMLEDAKLIGEATIRGRLFNIGSFPGLALPVRKADHVVGEVYQLDDKDAERTMKQLDTYEGAPYLYQRIQYKAVLKAGGKPVPVWAYVFNQPIDCYKQITSGDWSKR